jgi:hypothetical protein
VAETDLYVGKDPVTFDYEGAPVFIGPTIVIRAGHPIMKGREDMFTPLVVHFDVAEPTRDEPKATKSTGRK